LFSTAVKKICDIYDWDGKGELDMFFLGDVMYALGMNTTKKVSQENPPGSKKLLHHFLTLQSRKSTFLTFIQENHACSKKLPSPRFYPSVKKIRHVLKSYLTTFLPFSQENPIFTLQSRKSAWF
jgi:hypothetical protein